MLLMTWERCPECGQTIYLRMARKQVADENMIIADGCYVDGGGVLNICMFDEDTQQPDYCCIHCGWFA
tara:strand:+ start:271 stop:474 length:204 start_codon:yes stop_codon:yes gene_type:complete